MDICKSPSKPPAKLQLEEFRMKLFITLALSLLWPIACLAEVEIQTIQVPMRDGVRLSTDIYRDKSITSSAGASARRAAATVPLKLALPASNGAGKP